MQRSLLKFHNAIKSDATRERYQYCLNKFLEFCKLKEADDLLQLKESFLQEITEDYLFYLKKRLSPNSVGFYLAPLELFFAMNDKLLNWKKIKKMYPGKIQKSGREAYSNDDIKKMLQETKSKRLLAMIHMMASSGCRVGVLPELRMKHLIDIENCKIMHIYEGTNEEYWSFLTPEASNTLEEYLSERRNDGELVGPESPVFRTSYSIGAAKAKPLGYKSIMTHMWRIVKVVPRVKVGNMRYNKQMDHAFRKRFDTILKNNKEGNIALKEKLMGHQGVFKLDGTYHVPEIQVLFDEFKIHIQNLTISDENRDKITIITLQTEKDKALTESKNLQHQFSHRIRKQDRRILHLEEKIKELSKNKSDY